MNVWLSLLVCLVGALMYVFGKPGKVETMGLWSYVVGLLAFLLRWGGGPIK